jgi:hypothetical protein
MKKGTYILLIVLFFILLAAAGVFFLFVSELGEPSAEVPGRAYLEVNLSGAVDEVAPTNLFSALLPIRGSRAWPASSAGIRSSSSSRRLRQG